MAVLTMPDGTRVQVPDNATPAQIRQIADAYSGQKREASAHAGREQAWQETPWPQKVAVGFAKPFVETGLGIKSMFTELNDQDRSLLDAGKGVSGVAGTAGEIAGNLATFAVPGGIAAQGGRAAASMLPRAMARSAAARAATRAAPEVATMAGMEALKAPTDERTRGQAAAQAVAGAGAGIAAGKVLTGALGGVKRSRAATDLLRGGVPLTPGMAAKGSFVPWLEQRMAAIPLVGGRVAKLQEKALQQWNRSTLQSVAPPGAQISRPGSDGFGELQRAFQQSYGAIWNQQILLRSDPSAAWAQLVPSIAKQLPREQATRVIKNLRHVDEVMKAASSLAEAGQSNGNLLSQIDDTLREFAQQAIKRGDDEAAKLYKQARSSFREALPPNVNAALSELDTQYAKYAVFQRAATGKKALENDSVFTPADLMGAVKAKGSGRALARGKAFLQDDAAEAVKMFDGLVPNRNRLERSIVGGLVGGGALLNPKVAGAALIGGATLPNEVMRKLMTGHYKARPAALAKMLRKYGVTPATTGTATDDSSR